VRTLQEEGKRLKEVAENEMVRRFEMSSELQAMQRQLQSAVPSARSERRDERAEVERVRSEWRESEGEQLGGAVKVSCEGEQLEALLQPGTSALTTAPQPTPVARSPCMQVPTTAPCQSPGLTPRLTAPPAQFYERQRRCAPPSAPCMQVPTTAPQAAAPTARSAVLSTAAAAGAGYNAAVTAAAAAAAAAATAPTTAPTTAPARPVKVPSTALPVQAACAAAAAAAAAATRRPSTAVVGARRDEHTGRPSTAVVGARRDDHMAHGWGISSVGAADAAALAAALHASAHHDASTGSTGGCARNYAKCGAGGPGAVSGVPGAVSGAPGAVSGAPRAGVYGGYEVGLGGYGRSHGGSYGSCGSHEEALALAKQRRQAVEAVLDGPAPATAPATAPLGTGASPGPGAVTGAGGVGSGARLGYLSRAYSSTIRNRVPN
jgi:hypothetical protein